VSPSWPIHYLAKGGTDKIGQNILGGNEVEAVLQRLDRLTQDEARTTSAQTFKVIYGLVQDMRVVMDCEQSFFLITLSSLNVRGTRLQVICRKCPGVSKYVCLVGI
jgi:hypothetical protein